MIMHVSRLTPACQGLFNVIIINSIFDPSVCVYHTCLVVVVGEVSMLIDDEA